METSREVSLGTWSDPTVARRWTNADALAGLLDLPRQIAAAIVALDQPDPDVVVDVGSGPGDFLCVFLQAFPRAHGIWVDISPAMQAEAQDRLAHFRNRVDYVLANMTDLPVDRMSNPDVVLTSRASHHLSSEELERFYRRAALSLPQGGWLVNLDHVGISHDWAERYKKVRPKFASQRPQIATHRHDVPLHSLKVHDRLLVSAGILDVEIV